MTDQNTLLGPNDPPPFEVINPEGDSPVFLVADHTSNLIPESLNNLDLSDDDLKTHAAWDIGADTMVMDLAQRLNAVLVRPTYSRLVIDLNRRRDHNTLLQTSIEGRPITANINVTESDKQQRLQEIYDPYHAEIARQVQKFLGRGITPLLFSVHSYTRKFYAYRRPWDIGFLWVQDNRASKAMIEYFHSLSYCVGDNDPYDARMLSGATLHKHADDKRLPNTLLEVCNDRVDTEEKALQWSERIYQGIERLLEDPAHFTPYEGPMHQFNPKLENRYFEALIENAKKGQGWP